MPKHNGKKSAQKKQTAEELVAGLRRRGGHLPTKGSEGLRKKRSTGIFDW